MQSYISRAGGYLTNPDATAGCQFCSSRTTDQFLGPSFNIEYSHHWRNFGFMVAFIMFNVSLSRICSLGIKFIVLLQVFCIYLFTYLFRIRTGSLFGSLKKRFNRKST